MPPDDTLPFMQTEIIASILDVREADWDAINLDQNPFTSYAFLSALEEAGCIGDSTGWLPQYLLLREGDHLLGALPMYAKTHSWGEYVFDWAWAEAWQRYGMNYYPKLIVAVPFSPVTGKRLLMTQGADLADVLIKSAKQYADSTNASSLHWLFPTDAECDMLEQSGMQVRHAVQFEWHNRSYRDFTDFVSTMTSRKRKKVRRERRRVVEQGLSFKTINGAEITREHMDQMHAFYLHTIHSHGSHAYLNREFFRLIGDRLASSVVLIFAYQDGEAVAGALNIRSANCLYGRYWGCSDSFDSLHFETCYYQAIDYCIREGLQRFEGGAQGEHKLSRGFLPKITCSAHWMKENLLSDSITEFLERERVHVGHYRDLLNEHSPYKNTDTDYRTDGS